MSTAPSALPSSSPSSSNSSASSSLSSSTVSPAAETTLDTNALVPDQCSKTAPTKRMSETSTAKVVPKKKVALTRIDPLGGDSEQSKPKEPPQRETVYFEVELDEDNGEEDVEGRRYIFNWLDLMESRLRRSKSVNGSAKKNSCSGGGLDPFASDDEDQLRALAQKFEERYGAEEKSASAIKRKKNARKVDDYADLGYGYDSDDPFIDNSEVHDEIVPLNVEPAFGGFYINTGPLEFREKKADDDENSIMEAVLKSDAKEASQAQTLVKRRKKISEKQNAVNTTKKTMKAKTKNIVSGDVAKRSVKKKQTVSKTSSSPKGVTESTQKGDGGNSEDVVKKTTKISSEKTQKKNTAKKEGGKPMGRPKKRNPDGSLVHPPKLAKVKKPVLLSSKETINTTTTTTTATTATSPTTSTATTATVTTTASSTTMVETKPKEIKQAPVSKKRAPSTNKNNSASLTAQTSSSSSRVASVLEQNSSLSISKVPATLNVSISNAVNKASETSKTNNINKPIDNEDVRNFHDVVQHIMMGVPSPSSSTSKTSTSPATKLAGGATILAVNTANVGSVSKDKTTSSKDKTIPPLANDKSNCVTANGSPAAPRSPTPTSSFRPSVSPLSTSGKASQVSPSPRESTVENVDKVLKTMFTSPEPSTSPPAKNKTPGIKKTSAQNTSSPVSSRLKPSPAPVATPPVTTHGVIDSNMLQMHLLQQASMIYLQNTESFNQLIKQTSTQSCKLPTTNVETNARKASDLTRATSLVDLTQQKRPQELSKPQSSHTSSSQVPRSKPSKEDLRTKDEEIRKRHRESILSQQNANNMKTASALHNSASVAPASSMRPVYVPDPNQSRSSTWHIPRDSSEVNLTANRGLQEGGAVSLSSNTSSKSSRQMPSPNVMVTQPYLASSGISVNTGGHYPGVDPLMLSPPNTHIARQQPVAKLPTVPTPSVLNFAASSGAMANLTSNALFRGSQQQQQQQQQMQATNHSLHPGLLFNQQPK